MNQPIADPQRLFALRNKSSGRPDGNGIGTNIQRDCPIFIGQSLWMLHPALRLFEARILSGEFLLKSVHRQKSNQIFRADDSF